MFSVRSVINACSSVIKSQLSKAKQQVAADFAFAWRYFMEDDSCYSDAEYYDDEDYFSSARGSYFNQFLQHECDELKEAREELDYNIRIIYYDDHSCSEDYQPHWAIAKKGIIHSQSLKRCPFCEATLEPWNQNQVTIE